MMSTGCSQIRINLSMLSMTQIPYSGNPAASMFHGRVENPAVTFRSVSCAESLANYVPIPNDNQIEGVKLGLETR